jgi:hypothetical protein
MQINVTIREVEMEGDYGNAIDGVSVSCSRCGHSIDVFGTSVASIRRGCMMLREQCPNDEANFYRRQASPRRHGGRTQ